MTDKTGRQLEQVRKDILDRIAKEYKQEDFSYALKNCLHSYLFKIVDEAMEEYRSLPSCEITEEQIDETTVPELENIVIELLNDMEGCSATSQSVETVILPDGRKAQIQITIETDETNFI